MSKPEKATIRQVIEATERYIRHYATDHRGLFDLYASIPKGWKFQVTTVPEAGDPSLPCRVHPYRVVGPMTLGGKTFVGVGTLDMPDTYAPPQTVELFSPGGVRPGSGTPEYDTECRLAILLPDMLENVKAMVKGILLLEQEWPRLGMSTDTMPLSRLYNAILPLPYRPVDQKLDRERVLAEEKPLVDEALLTLRRMLIEATTTPIILSQHSSAGIQPGTTNAAAGQSGTDTATVPEHVASVRQAAEPSVPSLPPFVDEIINSIAEYMGAIQKADMPDHFGDGAIKTKNGDVLDLLPMEYARTPQGQHELSLHRGLWMHGIREDDAPDAKVKVIIDGNGLYGLFNRVYFNATRTIIRVAVPLGWMDYAEKLSKELKAWAQEGWNLIYPSAPRQRSELEVARDFQANGDAETNDHNCYPVDQEILHLWQNKAMPIFEKVRILGREAGRAGASNGSGAGKADELALSERQQKILEAMIDMGAVTSDSRRKTRVIAPNAEGKGADPDAFKQAMADLVKRGLVRTKAGRGGGCWLTEAGRQRADQLPKQ